jgi:hypothetical protein
METCVAPDPNFSSNGFIYLYRTKTGSGGCGVHGPFQSGRPRDPVIRTVNPGSLTELLSGITTGSGNHDGGVLRISPDQNSG